ncbi:MAG: cation transporter [Deltaproteobacteria bacterium]|nr:cation transporter [Deltaproteobacteria bacterium]
MNDTAHHTPRTSAAGNTAQTVRQVSIIGLVLNLFLSGLKILAGLIGASQAVVADGFHSLSDCITDIIVIIGVKYWSMPPDENHPYGHQRIETIVSIVVGLALAATAVSLGYKAAVSISQTPASQPGVIALVAALFSIGFKEALYQYTVRVGKKIRSSALEANAWHHRSDAFSSIPVAIAVVAIWIFPQFRFIDSIAAILVSLFILHTAWKIVRPNIAQLTDEAAAAQIIAQIESVSRQVPGVEDIHAIRTRNAGADVFVDLHVLVKKHLTIDEGHNIARNVKRSLIAANDCIRDVLVHIEPH